MDTLLVKKAELIAKSLTKTGLPENVTDCISTQAPDVSCNTQAITFSQVTSCSFDHSLISRVNQSQSIKLLLASNLEGRMKMDRRIRYALRIIDEDYGNHLGLSQIVGKINLSQSRFEHLFKQEVGKTYKSYLRDLRLTKAKGFLKDLSLNISEVAYKVGYSYPSNFARDFKNRFRKTPSQYCKEML